MKYSTKLDRLIVMHNTAFDHQYSFDETDKEFISFFIDTIDEMIMDKELDFSYDEDQYFALIEKLNSVDGFHEGCIYKTIQGLIRIIRTEKDNDWYKGQRLEDFLDILMFLRNSREKWEQENG